MGVATSAAGLWGALFATADALNIRPRRCWYVQGKFHFRPDPLDEHWSIAVSAESANRICVESCQDGVVRASMWTRADDLHRLSQVVTELAMTRLDAAVAAE